MNTDDILSNSPANNDAIIRPMPVPFVDQGIIANTPQVNDNPSQATPATSQQPQPFVSNKIPTQPVSASPSSPLTSATASDTHPLVQKAGLVRKIAETLAGGPRMVTTIGSDGVPKQVPQHLSKGALSLALVLSALSGGLAGASARGPNAAGQGGALGLVEGRRIAQAKKEAEDREFAKKSSEVAQRASVSEVNHRILLSTAELEHYQLDAISKAIQLNKTALDALDDDAIEGRQVTQQELLDGMKSEKYDSTAMLGPADGVREILNADGSHQRWEMTHTVVANPQAKIKITPDMYNKYIGIPGFPDKTSDAGKTFELPYVAVARANEQLTARLLATQRLNDVREALKGTSYADKVPQSIDFNKPGVAKAIERFQRYRSHVAVHGDDLYESIQRMAADPRDGKFAPDVATAYGGWNLLRKMHDAIEADSAATKTRAESQARADVEIKKEKDLIPVRAATAGAEAAARQKVVEGSARNPDGSWNPASIPVGLVQGTVDPTQLSKRSATYNSQIQQANEYSLQTTGKPFDMAQAQSDYKYATALSTQNTLKYLNSLTGRDNQSGNLGALVAMSNVVTRTQFPALNDAAAWGRLQAGDKVIAQYKATVTEVADQVAKILQGGGTGSGTSDAKLKQAQELFDTGFNKDQVKGVAESLRGLLANRKGEMVNGNRYLEKQYGKNSPASPTPITATNPQTGERQYWNGTKWLPIQ